MRAPRALGALALLAACAAAPWLPGPWATLRWFALCIAPGAAALLLLHPAVLRDAARATASVILASSVLAPLSYFALLRLLGRPDAALAIYGPAWGLLLSGAWLAHGGRGAAGAARSRTLAGIGLLGLVIALPLLLNADLRVRSDAWTHIALTRQVLSEPYPWTDPRFAGEPLRYFWFLNVWASGFAARGGTSIPWALALTNLAQAVAFVAALRAAAGSLFSAAPLRRAALAVALFGLNPLGLYGVTTHWLQGVVGATREADPAAPLSRLRFADAEVIHALTPYGTSFVAWIDKFVVVTAFGIAMTAAVLLATLLWEAARARRLSSGGALLLGVGFLAVLLHHSLAAAFLGLTLGASLLLPRIAGRGALGWRDTLLALGVLCAALLATLPYQASILAGRESAGATGYGLALQRVWALTAITAIGPLLALLWLGRRRLAEALGGAGPHFTAFAGVSLLLILCVSLPSVNENKMINLFYCAAAPAGAAGLLALRDALRRRPIGRCLWIALAAGAIAVPALIWGGHALHRDPPLPPGVIEALAWAREETPPEAVFIEPEGRRLAMNRVERDMLAGDRTFIRECGYPAAPLLARLALIERLYRTGEIAAEDREILSALGRPVYALYLRSEWPGGDDREAPVPATGDFVRVFSKEDARIYRFRQQEPR